MEHNFLNFVYLLDRLTSRQLVFRGHNLGEKFFRREETWHSSIFTEMKRGRWIIWQYWSTMIMSPGKNIRMGAFVLRRFYAPIHSPPDDASFEFDPSVVIVREIREILGKLGKSVITIICVVPRKSHEKMILWKTPHMSFQIFQRK